MKKRSELVKGTNDKKIFASKANVFDVVLEAERAYSALDGFRKTYKRYKDYNYGKQWGDRIKDPETGKMITEEEYIRSQGKVPLKNNLIRQLVKNVLGQFGKDRTEPICYANDRDEQQLGEMMTIAVKHAININKLWILDIRTLEEFLIGAVICQKVLYKTINDEGKKDVVVESISPTRIFFDTAMEDKRLWDCDLIGQVHDISISDLISLFADGSRERARELREKYRYCSDFVKSACETLTSRKFDNMDFFSPHDSTLCRVIEVWRKESKERYRCHDTMKGEWYKIEIDELPKIQQINAQRIFQAEGQGIPREEVPLIEVEWFVDRYWYARWITPFGEVLKEMETPYSHGSHPYILSIYPFIDGEAHSFVEDIIDQQRYINRLITMLDFIMGASAKGVLLFPEDQIPEELTIEDVADQWTKYNGVILFKPKAGQPLPQQLSVNATNIGATDMLHLQMQLMSEISGVHTAIRGGDPKSGTAASLYAQQAQNSATNLIDLLESFRAFREERDTKIMKVIQQFYTDKRYLSIAGNNYSEVAKRFDPRKIRHIDFDLTIRESTSTPAYRQMGDEFLMEIFKAGQIQLKDLLENSSMPFADRLLQSITAREEEMAQQQMIAQGGVPQEGMPQGNPLMQQMMSNQQLPQ